MKLDVRQDRLLLSAVPEAGTGSTGVRRLHGGDLSRVWHAAGIVGRVGRGLALTLLLATVGCGWRGQQKAIGYAYTAPATLNLRAELGLRAETTATLEHGERLEILETRRKFVKVRTSSGAEGWTDSALLLTQQQMDDLASLANRAKELPSQAVGTVFDTLNVHTAASRTSASFAKLEETDKIDVLGHRVTAREKGAPDDWYFVRAKDGRAGWVLSRMVLMLIPDEVAQYANGAYITSYHPLGAVNDESGASKPNWLWTTSAKARQPFEFDNLRVFIYNPRRKSYEAVFAERNVRGHYPVEASENGSSFSAVIEEADGTPMKRVYQFVAGRAKMVAKEPWSKAPALPEVSVGKAFDTTPPHEDNWAEKVRDYARWWLGI